MVVVIVVVEVVIVVVAIFEVVVVIIIVVVVVNIVVIVVVVAAVNIDMGDQNKWLLTNCRHDQKLLLVKKEQECDSNQNLQKSLKGFSAAPSLLAQIN